MSDLAPSDFEKLTLSELRQVLNATPQPYRVHVQIDSRNDRTTSTGSPFVELRLVDGSDSLVWRVFDNSPMLAETRQLPRGTCIELAAQWADAGKFGPEPRQPMWRMLTDDEKLVLFNGSADLARRQREDYDHISNTAHEMTDPRLRELCLLFLERFGDRFRRAAAARENHHARRGGLVEHVAQMMRGAAAVAAVYPSLNRDLLLAGVLFHDCGKMWENNYPEHGFHMPHDLWGELLGHIPLGLELVNKLWRDLMEQSASAEWQTLEPGNDLVRVHLLHLIGSHHGQYEFGAPVLPKTPEAIVLHHIDNIDAKMEMLRRGYTTSKDLGNGIFERFRPWPTHIVTPLPAIPPEPREPEAE
ncbi:MAG: HD domain-containing protein [Verrucomicrobiaceae bacterium]|nr:HD domain-containing protein [Verrucomicrobiaceae bacterium]